MLSYISAKEAAEKWEISQRRVAILCAEHRVEGAMMVGNMWIIPSTATKPIDKRIAQKDKPTPIAPKPFVKWVGGKSQLANEIERVLVDSGRAFTKYAEPMVGGGALLFCLASKYQFEEIYISDINAELINAYTVIKNDIDGLIAKLFDYQMLFLPMDESGRKLFYYTIRERFNNTTLSSETATEKAAQFIFLNKTCFNGLYRVNKNGQFNVPIGAYKNPTICDERNLRKVHSTIQKVKIVHGDYSLAKSFIDANTFVYIDPPYRPISETSAFTSYTTETFDDGEQIRLARFVDDVAAVGAKVVLSNSDPKNYDAEDDFFDNLYTNYTIHRVSAARTINSKGEKRGKINELLIHN